MVGLDTFVHVADNCYAVARPTDEERDVFEVPPSSARWSRRRSSATRPRAASTSGQGRLDRDARSADATYRAKGGIRRSRRPRRESLEKIEDPEARVKRSSRIRARPAVRVEGALRLARLLRAPHRRDRGLAWPPSMTPCAGATTGSSGPSRRGTPSASRDPRAHEATASLPESILEDARGGRDRVLRGRRGVRPLRRASTSRSARPALRDARVMRRGGTPVLKNDGAEAWDLGDGVLGLTFKSKANSIDADVIDDARSGGGARREGLRGMVVFNRASTSAWARTSS
jgi:3-hydroxyacyl-CoA dehydrogenase